MKPRHLIVPVLAATAVAAFVLILLGYNWGYLGGPIKHRHDLFSAIWRDDTNQVAKLVGLADVNEPSDQLGHPTPLIDAVKFGHLMIVKILLERGADPNKTDTGGHSPLFYALQDTPFLDPKDSNSPEICRMLIKHGANLGNFGISNAVKNLNSDDPRLQIYREAVTQQSSR